MGYLSPLPHLGTSSGQQTKGFRSPLFFLGLAGVPLPEGTEDVSGAVQSGDSTVAGVITRTAFRTISGGVQAGVPTLTGDIQTLGKSLSGGVTSDAPVLSGTVTAYPLTGWSLTNFTTNYAGLDPDSPFYNDPAYSNITHLPTPDKCHHETLTSPDGHTMTMNGLGEFTVSPTFLTQVQTFDVQIYDASDGTFGATATITIYPADADEDLTGAVQAQSATVTGAISLKEEISGGVQAGVPVVFGLVTSSPADNLKLLQGNVQAQSPVVTGTLENVIKMSGAVTAQAPILTGTLRAIRDIAGGVQAQSATVTGDLTPPTEEPSTTDSRALKQKFINRKVKWKTNQRKIH